jgi:hypothetical protein
MAGVPVAAALVALAGAEVRREEIAAGMASQVRQEF